MFFSLWSNKDFSIIFIIFRMQEHDYTLNTDINNTSAKLLKTRTSFAASPCLTCNLTYTCIWYWHNIPKFITHSHHKLMSLQSSYYNQTSTYINLSCCVNTTYLIYNILKGTLYITTGTSACSKYDGIDHQVSILTPEKVF